MEDMKVLKVQNGDHGGRHIGNSCHVTKKLILSKCESCILLQSYFYCIISLGCKK